MYIRRFLHGRIFEIFRFTCNFGFVSTTDDNKKDGATWNGVIEDNIDNENVNTETVNSINGFRVITGNNSGNDISNIFDIHSDSENYDATDDKWLQKQYKR